MIILYSILIFIIISYIIFKLNPELPKQLESDPNYTMWIPELFITKPQFEPVTTQRIATKPSPNLDSEYIWCGDQFMTAFEYNRQYQELSRTKHLKQNQGKTIIWGNNKLTLG